MLIFLITKHLIRSSKSPGYLVGGPCLPWNQFPPESHDIQIGAGMDLRIYISGPHGKAYFFNPRALKFPVWISLICREPGQNLNIPEEIWLNSPGYPIPDTVREKRPPCLQESPYGRSAIYLQPEAIITMDQMVLHVPTSRGNFQEFQHGLEIFHFDHQCIGSILFQQSVRVTQTFSMIHSFDYLKKVHDLNIFQVYNPSILLLISVLLQPRKFCPLTPQGWEDGLHLGSVGIHPEFDPATDSWIEAGLVANISVTIQVRKTAVACGKGNLGQSGRCSGIGLQVDLETVFVPLFH